MDDALLKFAVIAARSEGKWVFCRHRERTTLEIPGGHREPGESVDQTAARELREETGIAASPQELQFILRVQGRFSDGGELLDVYALRRDIPASGVRLQPGETVDARWFSLEEWEDKVRAGEIWAGTDTKEFFGLVRAFAAPNHGGGF